MPQSKTALGVGELAARTEHGDGTATWHWTEDDPTATYLTTATVGDFIYTVESMVETSTGRTLPVYNAIDSTATPTQLAAIEASLAEAPGQINVLSDLYGPYPFDSTGAVADRAAGVGYALEVQTKPHYSGGFTSGNPSINISTQAHELAHQWFGNSATLETWADIWFTRAGRTGRTGTGRLTRTAARTRRRSSTTSTPTPRTRTGRRPLRCSTATRRTCSTSSPPTSAGP